MGYLDEARESYINLLSINDREFFDNVFREKNQGKNIANEGFRKNRHLMLWLWLNVLAFFFFDWEISLILIFLLIYM